MMPPVSANQPMSHSRQQQQQQRQRRRERSSDSSSSSIRVREAAANSHAVPFSSSSSAVTPSKPTVATPSIMKEGSHRRRSMDPPAALDPADLLAELSMFDDNNGFHKSINPNAPSGSGSYGTNDDSYNTNGGGSSSHSNGIGIGIGGGSSGYSDIYNYSISGSETTSQAPRAVSAGGGGAAASMAVPTKQQQLGALRSKYFQPSRSSRQREQQQQHVSQSNLPTSTSTTVSLSTTTETSHHRCSGSASTSTGQAGGGGTTDGVTSHGAVAVTGSSVSGVSVGASASGVTHSIGTFTISTFKDDEKAGQDRPHRRPTSERLRNGGSRTRLKNYRMVEGERNSISSNNRGSSRDSQSSIGISVASSSTNNNNNNNNNGSNIRGRRRNSSTKEMFNGAESDDDNWMEDALLNGIPAANMGMEPNFDVISAPGARGDNDIGDSNVDMTDQAPISTKQLLGRLLDTSDPSLSSQQQQQQHGRALSRGRSDITESDRTRQADYYSNQQQPQNQQRSKSVKFSRSHSSGAPVTAEQLLASVEQQQLGEYTGSGTGSGSAGGGQRTTVGPGSTSLPLSHNFDISNHDSMDSARRITIADLTNPEISMDDLLKKNHNEGSFSVRSNKSSFASSRSGRQHRHREQNDNPSPPPDALSNIPVLPTINTYTVTKNRPDEPAGLFLTKAKNGAVLVHSLSPESLFRESTPLHPGQEVLSVNEKRVNDPKMAATLITQAKRNLSLRISTVERSRGFMYCQVKRRNNSSANNAAGGGTGAGDTTAVAVAGGEGTNAEKNTGGAAAGGTTTTTGGGGRKRGRGQATGPFHHGVRFVTASVDGVRRSTLTEGLVRVSHIDPLGLFANSHPMNRLRVGGIVLTVNGAPVTNGRTALEKVMGSRQLVEVLHCDERVWREDWVKDGLEQVLSGGQRSRSPNEITSSIFNKSESSNNTGLGGGGGSNKGEGNNSTSVSGIDNSNKSLNDDWDLEWKPERDEVTLRKKKTKNKGSLSYAFKLIFNIDVGTCHPELVDDNTMMPPADEFDVSLLVKMVNDSQRTMMTVLQNMLRRAKFELKFGSGALRSQQDAVATAAVSKPAPLSSRHASDSRNVPTSRESVVLNNDNTDQQSSIKRRERINSCVVLTELVEDEHGGANEELCQLADSLLRVDDRDRKRNTLRVSLLPELGVTAPPVIPRRGSTGLDVALDELSRADIEQWRLERWENQPTTNKIREFSARQHKMDEQYNHSSIALKKGANSNDVGGNNSLTQHSQASLGGSMFSTDMLEDFLDYLEDASAAHDSVSTPDTQGEGSSSYHDSPPSPRDDDDANKWIEDGALRISPPQDESPIDAEDEEDDDDQTSEKKGDDEMAYITGVWRDVASKYEVSEKIVGSGGFGEVRDCYDKKTGQIYVVKTIFKPEQNDTTKINLIRNEILLLHEAHHPNIVELRDLFEDDKYVHIVMERCTGGDLFDRVVNENPRRLRSPTEAMKHEARTANSMRSILHVLKYLHSKGIVHRDIKPEHFLLTSDERETQKLKLIDFGLARKHKPGSAPMTTFTGSPSFVAPEVIARRYDHMCDMFSVGVTAYFLLTGMLPFDGPSDEETFDLISAGKFKFPSSAVFLSDDAKDFITKLLKVDPNKRMSAVKSLNHPWLLKAASC